ncbi:unnamed protein product [Chironomus riparius]|uniref:Calcium homeostasis endoplasmic reticulum protein n=1 Tax=Chironomus riparius TaxID=315576 RepID=A0A9N9RUX4_9DIPT|nr:unnamed protein product [Chironomus riparius]
MSVPVRPSDQQLANIIDKLAEFVGRNGPEFENMTKIKQQNNSKFSFLQQGKEFNDYYQYRVIDERRKVIVMQQQPQNNSMQNIWSSNGGDRPHQVNINTTAQIEAIKTKQLKLKEQIVESEKNLNAQHQVLLQQQKTDIEEALAKAQFEYIKRCALENEISLTELDEILQPIIQACTKDSIANGKSSILQQATNNSAKRQIISQYILKKAMSPNAPFNQKLHLIYLINDLLHHCVKKNVDDLKNNLESVVIPMFCQATMCANDEQKDKLNKLLNLWASKANFFDSCALSKLATPSSSLQEYQNSLLSQYSTVIAPLNLAMKKKFDDYRNQHKAFVEHATNQLTLLEAQKQTLEQQNIQQQSAFFLNELTSNTPHQQVIPSILSNVNLLMNQNHEVNMMQNMYTNQNFSNPQQQPSAAVQNSQHMQNSFGQESQNNQQHFQQNFNLPPPSFSIPDFSRPPPGFNNDSNTPNSFPNSETTNEEVNLTPTMPYFDLPSGLIVPLIRLEDFSYHSIDPEKIQLPPPSMPTEKLLSAIEAFYAPPSHDRPRNEGWEKLGLYEYFKIKNAVRKQKEEAIMRFEREKSKSPTPIPDILIRPMKKSRKRVYRSQSPDNGPKSRSSSPETKIAVKTRKQRSKSPSRSPPFRFNRDSRNNRDSKADRMINRKRSISPPILPSFSVASNKSSECIDEGNKGHLMLKKMGWESGGLGLIGNQGITQPISGGEVRDRSDLYKGIGMNMNDPYENFRKNRSNSFITRMKSRSETEKN